jgi:hypothetical protein
MAFTDHSDLFAAVHEHGINTTIGHLMRQRPSLFNYATILFTQAGDHGCDPAAAHILVGTAGRTP